MWTDEAGVTDDEGGIWQSGGGLMSDGTGRIFVSTGNGVTPAPGPGTSPPGQLANSVVRLAVASGGSLAAGDFFSPANAPGLNVNDQDLGSGSPVGLPFGTGTYPHLLVAAGKDGRVFLLNRDGLGGRETGAGHTDNPVSKSGPFEEEFGHPAAFGGSGGADYVYYNGSGGPLRALQFNGSNPAHPVLADVANSTSTFGYTSGSPVVTSSGSNPASAIVWEVYLPHEDGANARLEAFDAVPQKVGTTLQMKEIWSAPIGTGVKFASPATSNGRVYVGTRDGHVLGFGPGSPLSGTAVSFGQVAVSSTGSATAKLTLAATETQSVTISSITTSAPFAATSPALPVTLSPSQRSITVPVTFSPTGPGGATGSLSFATNLAEFPTVSIGLSGDGTKPGFYASPGTWAFGTIATGSSKSLPVDIINGGTAPETVTDTSVTGGPFTATGLPLKGTSVPAGKSVTVTVTYKPAAAEADSGSLTVTGPDGAATVSLSGTGVTGQGTLTASPAAVSFGAVPLGQSPSQAIDVTNTGNLPVTITGTAAPGVPFGIPDPVSTGLTLDPGNDLQVPVTFTPDSAGQVSGTYQLTASDGRNAPQTVTVTVSGTGTAPASGVAVPGPGGGWTLNGSAQMSGTNLNLTQAAKGQTGSAVYYQPVSSDGLHAQFTAQLGDGTGGDGMTFALLDASSAALSSLGAGGGGLGFARLPGVAVTLDTYQDADDPSANFASIATGTSASGGLTYAATATDVPDLRSDSHTIGVTSSGGTLTVTVDGKQYLSAPVTLPPTVLAAFTSATGGLDDVHAVRNVTISAGGTSLPPPGGGWSYNGSATMSGSGTDLTQAVKSQNGSVVYPTPVLTNGLQAQFNVQIGGGTGADGMTFSLLDPARTTSSALGGGGSGLGYSGLPGIAVTLNTYKDTGYPTNNFIGISASATKGLLKFQATVQGIGQLRSGTHTVGVDVSGRVLTVWLDGQQVLAIAENLPAASLLAFTASTGGLTDIHAVRDAAISAASYALTPPGGAGWSYNGAAKMNGTSLILTPAARGQHGSAFNGTPVPSAGLSATFTAQIGPGNGNGMALVLLDASRAGPGSLGTGGSGLGYGGLPGIAVALNTYQSIGYPSANFVGIATGGTGPLTFAATSSKVPSLHGNTNVAVTVSGTGEIRVSVNGTQVLDTTVTVPQNVLVGLTAATGAAYEQHAVSNVTVTP
jgi:hypothetical protein